MMRRLGDESGQTLIMVALGMTVMIGFLAFATDIGVQLHEKRMVQSAADAAAVAGAAQLLNASPAITTAGQAAVQRNGFPASAVTMHNPPDYGTYATTSGYVEAIVSQSSPTFFMNLFGTSAMTISARAVARLGNGSICIYALSTSGTSSNPAIAVNNSGDIYAPTCGVQDNSNLVVAQGQITAQSIGVADTSSNSANSVTPVPSPAPSYGVAPVSDPLAYLTPPQYSSCVNPPNGGNGSYANGVTLGPATSGGTICYNGLDIANGATNITFTPGVYVINGNLTIGGGITATASNVTFYFPSSGDTINIANGSTVNFTAPTSGSLSGILFWQSSSDSSPISFAGGAGISLQGVLYAPAAAVNLSNNTGTNIYLDVVANTLSVVGSAELHNYVFLPGQANPFKAVQLVE